jgi:hypothetical protein
VAVDKDPELVTRTLTQTTSTFGRDDVDRYLVDRICDVGEIERLADRIFAEDKSLVLLSPEVADGVWTTREMQDIEQQVAADARARKCADERIRLEQFEEAAAGLRGGRARADE